MMNTSEGAGKFYPLRGWTITPEKEHNLQLLQLLAILHGALQRMPRDLAQVTEEYVGLHVGSGAPGTAELEDAARIVEDLAVKGFIRPYLTGMANELGTVSSNDSCNLYIDAATSHSQ